MSKIRQNIEFYRLGSDLESEIGPDNESDIYDNTYTTSPTGNARQFESSTPNTSAGILIFPEDTFMAWGFYETYSDNSSAGYSIEIVPKDFVDISNVLGTRTLSIKSVQALHKGNAAVGDERDFLHLKSIFGIGDPSFTIGSFRTDGTAASATRFTWSIFGQVIN